MKKIGLSFFLIIIVAVAVYVLYLWSLAPEEKFPADTFLESTRNKSALILVAHDDDAVACAGTTAKLIKAGWTVNFVCYYGQQSARENSVRKAEMRKSGQLAGLSSINLVDFEMMRGADTIKNIHNAIPYHKFATRFNTDSINYQVAQAINKYKPAVIFTLDDVIGGTGNPAHVAMSKAIIAFCEGNKHNPNFSVQKIYQPVYPPSLQKNTIDKNAGFQAAKKIYATQGMPAPQVEIDIDDVAGVKKQIMLAHASQHNSLRKMWPYYKWYPGWLYFKIFNKEYFRVINL